MAIKTADDNMFSGDSNPFSGGSGGTSNNDPTTDDQMQATQAAPQMGGDSMPIQPPNSMDSQNTASKSVLVVTCLKCSQEGTMRRIASDTKCRCGSDDLVYYPIRVKAEFPPKKDNKEKKPDADNNPSSPSNSSPGGVDSPPLAAPPVDPNAPVAPPAAPVDPNAPPAPAEAPADDTATAGGDPSSLEKDPEPAAPAAVPGAPVDPAAAAPPVPGAMGTDPMDMAQTTLDSVVEQANALGHDAMETAYDVDQLFSEWRCQNCGIEGRGDISEDGQVAFSGDLLDQPQGCAMPQGNPNDPAAAQVPPGAPADPNAPPAAPDAAAAAPVAPGAPPVPPVDPAAVPPVPPVPGAPAAVPPVPGAPVPPVPGAPVAPAPEKKDDKDKPEPNNQPPKKASFAQRFWRRAVVDNDQVGLNDNRDELDTRSEDDDAAEKMAVRILSSNPGMNFAAALEIAEDTITRFPSVRN